MSDTAMKRFMEAVGNHVKPEAQNIVDPAVTLRVPVCYRIRVRGTDAQYEVVSRFTGFTVPNEGDPENLILEFVAEHSFRDPNAEV